MELSRDKKIEMAYAALLGYKVFSIDNDTKVTIFRFNNDKLNLPNVTNKIYATSMEMPKSKNTLGKRVASLEGNILNVKNLGYLLTVGVDYSNVERNQNIINKSAVELAEDYRDEALENYSKTSFFENRFKIFVENFVKSEGIVASEVKSAFISNFKENLNELVKLEILEANVVNGFVKHITGQKYNVNEFVDVKNNQPEITNKSSKQNVQSEIASA